VRDSDWSGFAFDMARAEVFPLGNIIQPSESAAVKIPVANRTWEEHCRNPLISRFKNDTLITVDEEE
jgi:hypothetical protein